MMKKVIEKRRSLRDFSKDKLKSDDFELLCSWLDSMPKLGGDDSIIYKYYDDGDGFFEKLNGVAGYGGKMIKAPQYLVVQSKIGNQNLISAGYAAEWLMLKMTGIEIGSCWISTSNSEEKIDKILSCKSGYTIASIMAIGYAEKPSFLASIFGDTSLKRTGAQMIDQKNGAKLSSRMKAEDFIYMDAFGTPADLVEIEAQGYLEAFDYMRFAPSSLNRQPWRFVIGENYILLAVDTKDGYADDRLAYIEGGIAMLYFKVAMAGAGFDGEWQIDENIDRLGTPDSFIIAGAYRSKN